MELLRPGTAPCHRPGPEKWTEVDAVVRDMFSSAASAATSSNSMPQRPHTACVCARPVAVVVEEDANPCIVGAEDSDDDSDGASIDEEGPDPSPEEPVRPSTAAAVVASWQASLSSRLKEPDAAPLESPTQLRPRTAPAALWKVNGDNIVPVEKAPLVDPAPAKPRRAAPTLPSGDMLLLGGGLWNQSSQRSAIAATPSEEPAKAEASAAGSPTSGRAPPREIPKAVAKQLPKQCTFLPFGAGSRLPGRRAQGGARPAASGLTPSAAKMRSHVSWAQFTPMRRFNSTQPEAPAAASKHPAKQPELAEKATPVAESAAALVASSTPVPSAAQQQQMQQLQQLQHQQHQLQQHPMASGQVDDAMHPAKRARIEQPPEVIEDAMLNDEQRSVADRCLRGENLFITGAAGNGKSFLLRYIIQELQKRHQPGEVVITAPTGLAAVNIGGQTIHSFAGIGPMGDTLKAKDYPVRVIVNKIRSNTTVETRWKTMCALVIDEVSMLEPYLFEWLEHAARLVRGSRTCFGGVHLILCGDFLQLPPVESSKDLEAKHVFCFETPAWEKCGLSQGKIVLTRAVRQSGDLAFAQLLHDVRAGICSRPVWETLSSCHIQRKPKPNDGIEPTKLYCTNRDVDQENERRLAGLVGEVVTYSAEDRFGARQGRNEDATNPSNEKKKLKEMLNKKIPDKLHLKVAAQVVLLKNMPQKGLVNGSRGRVLKLEGNKNAVVVFDNGREHKVEMEQFTQSSASSTLYRKQLPLRLAWALTIHRSQGMTLTRAEVQLDDVFSHGQAYVALSRLTGFAGLWLGGRYPGISERSIRSHPRALEFYGLVKERSMPASA
mmetsp:Transcript_3405/g.6145  ORF Transcript_3405/g.6145 Transcript_3405/m.6145 type:complete len:833 (+) Transcript_3405:96-2594(+)